MKPARARFIACLGFACLLASCAQGAQPLTRVSRGVPYEGRFIDPDAYAAYLRGSELETQGALAEAREAYRAAAGFDDESPEIWARIGALECRLAAPAAGVSAARAAFQRALTLDADCPSAFYERALCAERANDRASALADARRAVDGRPDDEAANALVTRLLLALGRGDEARAWLTSLGAFAPRAAQRTRARAGLQRGDAPATDPVVERLRAGDDAGALRAAQRATLRPSALALLAVLHGRAALARSQAELELDADPSNADAWVASLAACDLLRDAACFERHLPELESPALALSPLGNALLAELLARRTGAELPAKTGQ